ncbi:MAG: hypothetical protein AAF296_04645 [Pseudomonadota bacterium]
MRLTTQISVIIAYAAFVWGSFLLIRGQELSWELLAPFGVTVSVVTLSAVVFVNWIWKQRFLRNWLVQKPDLTGTWKCKLISNFKIDGERVEKDVYVVIRQTLVSFNFYLYSDEAISASIAENLTSDRGGLFSLAVMYRNTPSVELRGERSEIHYGSALFTDISYDAGTVEGHYWTDRNTNGSLKFLERKDELVEGFDAAKALFQS